MTPTFFLLATVTTIVSSQVTYPNPNFHQSGNGIPNYAYQPNYGYGQGGYPFSGQYYNQYSFPQMQYPPFYGGGSYNGMPFSGATVSTGQSVPVPPGTFPLRESTVVETITPNQGFAILGNPPPPTGQVMIPQGVYQPNIPIAPPQQPSVIQSNTVQEVEVPNPSPNPGHYEFYQYGRGGFEDGKERKLLGGLAESANPPQRRIQHPFSVQKRPHFEFYKYARSEPTLYTP